VTAPGYFDTHCHLQDQAFSEDRPAVLSRARTVGVSEIVAIASNPADAAKAKTLADETTDPRVWFTAGLHPHEASAWKRGTSEAIERMLDAGAVAVGEIGLDYHYDNSPRDVQRRVFGEQLALAADRDLPVVVHSRDAEDDTLAVLAESSIAPNRVVLHCFSSSRQMLDHGVERGYYVSFSGMITFRSFPAADLVPRVPEDRLLAETDAPYLAPAPHRGRRNEPAYVVETVAALAALRGIEAGHVVDRTRRNGLAFYRLGQPD
jgi:TatD DNase family protein